jgi:oxygen-independent coproporphyrinogen-3 oxidase
VESAKKLIPRYVELLCEEIKRTGEIAKNLNLKLETVYIGGGTPTTLSAQELNRVLDAVEGAFDLSDILEYTVEAGRPDTVTKEKLETIKNRNVTRISINPQTLSDEVLKRIGRNHTAKQMIDAFYLARELGFNNINTDLIAGLPDETLDSFKETLDTVLKLNPENVTVHSLSMKRASRLSASGELPEIEAGKTAREMVDYARRVLTDNGILPYYMYRQSKTVGNLENVGYAKKGFEGLYNVYIMDETHTILGCGASAVTKLKQPHGTRIERIFNFKYPFEYINRFDELMERKQGITDFYKEI